MNRLERRSAGAAVLLRALLTLLPLLLAAAPAHAQDEFLINDDRVDRNQWAPRVARGSTGTMVVAWMDGRNLIGSAIDFDIYLMTIRDPLAIGSTVNRRLNDDAPGAVQGFPSIAASQSGTFFCVWEDGRAGQRDIYGATLDSIGLRITPNLRMNDDSGFSEQANPQVASVGTRYLAIWGDQRQGQGEIFASKRTSSGAPIGPNFLVSSDTTSGGSYQGEPGLAARADGKTLVAWLDGREGGSVFGATFDVYAQWLDEEGQPIGGNFKVNNTTGPQRNTSVAVATDSTNGFVVAWIDRRNFPADPGDVYAQRYDASGAPIGGNVRVNDDGPGREQRAVRAVDMPEGVFLVWEDLRGNLGLDSNVEAARIALDSSPPGINFRINVSIPARQGAPGAVWDGRDAILAAWEDGRNGAPDIYAISIFPTGVRRGSETQLNDDAAGGDQRRPGVGRGPGRYVATWIDRRSGRNELFGQWVTAAGGRDGPNHRIWPDDGVTRTISASSAVEPGGSALVVAHVTRDSDAGEIRGFHYATIGAAPASSFWISDSLPSAQAIPAVTANASGYAAVWLDHREGVPRVYAQELAANGVRVGSNHAVLSAEPADPVFALDIDADPLGGYWLCYAEGAGLDQRLWIVHLGANLLADRDPAPVAPSMPGERSHPSMGAGPDGRVEIAWLGSGAGGLGQCYHQGFDHSGNALGGVYPLGPADGLEAQAAPRLAVAGQTSVATWEAHRDGNWSVWLQALASGAAPKSGVLRIDQDILGADQLDPSPGLDVAGRVVVIWSDARSSSSGTDIVGRVFAFGPTSVTEPPPPPPAPEPPPPAPPRALRVGPAQPNPFSGMLGVAVEVPAEISDRVIVRVVGVRGETVATLYDGPTTAERLLVRWDGTDRHSHKAASGVYWIVAEAGGSGVRFVSYSFGKSAALIALVLTGTAAASTATAAEGAVSWGGNALRSVARAPGVRVVTASGRGSPAQAVDALEQAGYHVDVAVLPETFFVRPAAHASPLPAGFVDATPPEMAPLPDATPPDLFGGHGDLLPPSAAHSRSLRARGPVRGGVIDLPVGLPYGARWEDTSEYMVGRVAVPILFPDSDGSIDPDHYDWTPALRDSVVRSAVRGFLKWTAIANARGVPLTFLIEIEPVSATRYEPIDRTVAEEHLWIEDTLEPLVGYRNGADAMAYELANAARARLGTHWAALLFAVQNDTDPDGKFADMIGEHALLGGPYFVVMVRHSNVGSTTLDFYIEHEVTHMFWALDEYPANNAWWACTERTGYFDQANTNSDVPIAGYCGPRQQCFMKGNYPDSLCAATGRQIGWVDLDGTGVLDLYETRPGVRPDSIQYTTGAGVPITVRGAATDLALPNQNPYQFPGDSITIATVDSIWHRVDGGAWIPVAPDDGIFDQGKERFTFLLPSPSIGNHLLEFQARNSSGRSMAIPASAVITVTGGAGAIGGPASDETALYPRLVAGPVPSAGGVRFSLAGRGGAPATARLYDVAGREIRAWPLSLSSSGIANWEWDGRVSGGAAGAGGLYFLVVEIESHRITRRVVLLH